MPNIHFGLLLTKDSESGASTPQTHRSRRLSLMKHTIRRGICRRSRRCVRPDRHCGHCKNV